MGQFAVKTDWRNTTLTVSAPGYQTATVTVPDEHRYLVIAVDLQPATQARTAASGAVESSGDSPAARLQNLQSLYDQGLISDQEYKRTRTRLMNEC